MLGRRSPRRIPLSNRSVLAALAAMALLALGEGPARAQTTYYVNASTGHDACYDGLLPVPSDLCPIPLPQPPIPGPFRTITRAAQAATAPASGTPVTILVPGLSAGGGATFAYDAMHGEAFPIAVPRETVVRYDAANATPGFAVRVVAPASPAAVFTFVAIPGSPYSSAGGLDGSTFGGGADGIQVEGAHTGVLVQATGFTASNAVTISDVRFWRSADRGLHVLADSGTNTVLTYASPTIRNCAFTADSSGPSIEHLRIEAAVGAWVNPTATGNAFTVDAVALPRVTYGIHLLADGTGSYTSRAEGTYTSNTVTGLADTCAAGGFRGIDVGCFVDFPADGTGAFARVQSVPSFTTCTFGGCGIAGFAVFTTASTGSSNVRFTLPGCLFAGNGTR